MACPNWRVRLAARIIRGGGVIAYPTEGVFGLGCDPGRKAAIERILQLKGRSISKGFILIAADFVQLQSYLLPLTASTRSRLEVTWPGPVTWLLPARGDVPPWLRGRYDTLAVRVTAHPLAACLCRTLGHALVSTSANRAGRPPAQTTLQVRRSFGSSLDYILPGITGKRAGPSEIRDGRTGQRLR
ncbi:L-threonylcarbamoyladenylate synthase [Nitrosococcus oceani]|uniref:Threonylcarbamoyl-AMP synthase n=2 Tax=Nitrosococcus oceani TaxID=1229 RepID=TSAC_NITOC|nr:Sua5/YciO/YrdC/YwlC family protein [Nitrosococcus oceani]Q3J7C4.1 RecName: Full=Threonylcarbamoyl-AMP synthase; Short=TC-AMP synthase; AltName: Full=L-threonylcarbamoyladenylate synthase; AltName: Full=t(6)A37 threonylcarbamoyladenosine biosynthesis protein TsaC; AltName: Full=tRNA threonylcarbamoyladenosine biosynthesis protein TsaC [Nitrosococcus oceani ATCC 19707]KFI18300.1 tRNA threonylcarbamoyladenosine biosynthesis protein RimN [Nitrosococcus oceani C-27]ABA59272.1 translation factor SU